MRLAAKLGFCEVERFEEYGAERWFGVWSSVSATPSSCGTFERGYFTGC
jgi:hypothetical protein